MANTVKRVWKSAVARSLIQQHRKQPLPDSRADRMIAQGQKGISPAQCAAFLAKQLRNSDSPTKAVLQPVNLPDVCAKVGLTAHYRPLGVDGLLQETESGYVAVIDSTVKPSRQRFTLAHEIGHLMLYKTTGLSQSFGHVSLAERKGIDSSEVEELCDHFASELIMPSEAWCELISSQGFSLGTLKRLTEMFGVSTTSGACRMVEVSEIDCAIIIWSPIYENNRLAKLTPIRSWVKLPLTQRDVTQSIERNDEALSPGSPFYAFDMKSESVGRISLSLNGTRAEYLAQSDLIDTNRAVSILIPERFRSDVMRRH